ncbi:hypothetical protein PISMIDRAFT_8008 [Pisolithus microcarpus 441]|uniref:RNA polymerase II elongation factor ELL N-terminal domain-containing protein n=1 Tax=Pisolithus microcarpus 441 TaxID=765257 RepID=A0A0C9ZE62_9AGAM|nr:hypothetical protein PISMIDRAFT_8008 [Pisolithus microcarpus 441]
MPLPDTGPLSLHSGLGNAVQSKPKQAMIVRLSAETLEALEAFPNHPEMHFDFGDNPGIYIGETFYAMRAQQESSSHEIYLRTSSAAKPNAPLKLYANVIGKFMVERQLVAKVTDGVRQRTLEAKKAHSERQAILLEQPPIPTPATKHAKRKTPGSGTVIKKAVAPVDQLRVPSTSSAPLRKVSPLPQNPPSSRANADVRRRLVHCLAIQPRLSDDAVRMVGGANISVQAREELLRLLEEVAEQTPVKKGDRSPRPWTLKTQTWTEVRPYEWPKLTETERTNMARHARMALKALKIPESDPAWHNVRYRQPGPPPSAPPPSSQFTTVPSAPQQSEAKPPVISKDVKQKARIDGSRAKGEISMKDESAKVSASRPAIPKRDQVEKHTSSVLDGSGTKSATSRRLPGSGYQAKKTSQPSALTAQAPTEKISASSSDPRPTQRQPLPASLPKKPASPLPPLAGTQARKTVALPHKTVKRDDQVDLEREREREQRERAKRKEAKLREREHEKEKLGREKGTAAPGFKRKTTTLEPEGARDEGRTSRLAPPPKKRRVEDYSSSTVTSSSSKSQEHQEPRRPKERELIDPPLKVKEESTTPLRGLSSSQDRRSPSPSKVERPKTNGPSTKMRRKSPIYTSSEDEGEIPQPMLQARRTSLPPAPTGMDLGTNGNESRHRSRTSLPLPTDHAALRARYRTSYAKYLDAFSKIVTQKQHIEAMLNGESESDIDLMDPDEHMKLRMEHNALKEELERIQGAYKGTSSSPSE